MRLSRSRRASSVRTVLTGAFLSRRSRLAALANEEHNSQCDSLDRTNFVQDILSRTSVEQYLLLVRREWVNSSTLWSYHRELWAENGDALSRIYAGTGALNTSFTRSGKRTLAGKDRASAFLCLS